MDLVFEAFGDLRLTENHVWQLHQTLLRHCQKGERHRGSYKTFAHVVSMLLLLRAGYAYVPYTSLERVVYENKDLYYKALRRTQTTLKGETPD